MAHLSRLLAVLNTLCLRGLGSAVSVAFAVLVSRHLPTDAASQFFFLLNACVISATCFRWGLDEVIIRRIASTPALEVPLIANGLIAISHRRVMAWSLIALIAFIATVPFHKEPFPGLDSSSFIAALVASMCVALTACVARVEQGLGRTNLATFLLNIVVPGLSLLVFLMILGFGASVDARTLIFLYASISLGIYITAVTTRYAPPWKIWSSSQNLAPLGSEASAANKLGGVVLAQQALGWTALIVVPLAYGAVAYKGFVVIQKVTTLLSLMMLAVNFTLSARFAQLYASEKYQELRRAISAAVIAIVISSAGASLVLIMFSEHLFDYARLDMQMYGLFIILLASQTFFSVASLFSVILSMCRNETFLLLAQSSINVIGLIAFIALSRTTTIENASIALTVAYAALAAVLGMRVLRVVRPSTGGRR